MHGSWNATAPRRAHRGPVVLSLRSRVEQYGVWLVEVRLDVLPGGHTFINPRTRPRRRPGGRGCRADGMAACLPGREAAVEQARVLVAEVLERPEGTGGTHA